MKNIVVTGVSRGLGLALAMQFSDSGYRVIGTCRKQEDVERLQSRFGPVHRFVKLDSTDAV